MYELAKALFLSVSQFVWLPVSSASGQLWLDPADLSLGFPLMSEVTCLVNQVPTKLCCIKLLSRFQMENMFL